MAELLRQLRQQGSAVESKWLRIASEDRRHGQLQDAILLELQGHGLFDRNAVQAIIQDWQRACARICFESWNVEELSKKANAAKVVIGKLEQEKLDALRAYAAEVESLRGRLRQTERGNKAAAAPQKADVGSSHATVQQATCDIACKANLVSPSSGEPIGFLCKGGGSLHAFEGQTPPMTTQRNVTSSKRALSLCSVRLGQALAYARPGGNLVLKSLQDAAQLVEPVTQHGSAREAKELQRRSCSDRRLRRPAGTQF